MAFNQVLADRVREYLAKLPDLQIEEKKMFSGMAFLVNGKMCVNISGDNLMCRYDPDLHHEIAEKTGFETMLMSGRELQGYCYVTPDGFKSNKDFAYWMELCLEFNERAKSSKKKPLPHRS